MANTLKFKRGLVSTIPTAALGEPLFTTDTFDLYIGNGTGNTRFQKYIASGATTQILRGDGSLYTFPLAISSPTNGQVLKYNGTSWVNDSDSGITGSGSAGQVAYFTGATTQGGSNNLFWDATNNRLGIGTNNPLNRLQVDGVTVGLLTVQASSDRVGIGTTSPNSRLEVYSASGYNVIRSVGASGGYFESYSTAGVRQASFGSESNGDTYFGTRSNNPLIFLTNNTERMRLDASGNLGLGVTPSAWGTTNFTRALELSTGSLWAFGGVSSLYLSSNIYYNGSARIYKNTGTASEYAQISGAHIWYSAVSGSAGGTVTLTQPMTLTANGRLLLGTTTEGTQRLQVAGDVKFDADAATNGFYWDNTNKRLGIGTNAPRTRVGIELSGATAPSTVVNTTGFDNTYTTFGNVDLVSGVQFGIGVSQTGTTGTFLISAAPTSEWCDISYYARNNIFFSSGTERMRIDANGSVGIGTTSGLTDTNLRIGKALSGSVFPTSVTAVGTVASTSTTGAVYFQTSAVTENATFTLPNLYHYRATQGTFGASSTVTNQFGFIVDGGLTGATNNFGFYGNIASGTGRWNLYMNGTAANYLAGQTAIGDTSVPSTTTWTRALTIGNNGTNKVLIGYLASSTNGAIIGANNSALSAWADLNIGGSNLIFRSGGENDRGRIHSSGNWLVGTSTDSGYRLDVVGTFRTTTTTYLCTNTGNTLIGSTSDSGEKLQVTGTMKVTGASTFNSTVTYNGSTIYNSGAVIRSDNGTAAAPSISFDSDLNTGIYRISSDTLGIATGGVEQFRITSTGATFSSSVTVGGNLTVDTNSLFVDATNNRVGIGTALPLVTNHVDGVFRVTSSYTTTVIGTDTNRNFLINATATGTSAVATMAMGTGTAPSSSPSDMFQMYSADVVAGNAAPHFRTENGAVIKLYQETTGVGNSIFSQGGGNSVLDDSTFDGYTLRQIVKALRNQGILQ